ncbi:helix-turn-helix domain-containing protein [Nocardioides baekrokdamisoli]
MREASALSGMSQAQFARALGTSASRYSTYATGATVPNAEFYVRAKAIAAGIAQAHTQRLTFPLAAADILRVSLKAGELEWAWRIVLQCRDHTQLAIAADASHRLGPVIDAWDAIPAATGDPGWDALLAALVRHAFDESDLEPPTWTQERVLTQAWIPDHPFLDEPRVIAQTPAWLAAQNIFVPARDLVTA